ncbi:nectin cell adhesion molecule 1a isoform X2 [Alosa sapidissima]|uniref:nectin cell adhesion molecule 1a isoform X2 n=1 Tax=Alosa sapidissima TaxID=34773 RepID=UPI001C099498|nr:nectin cell adhesion molecule 1a isoform X2 [Alosa sapidissima]
MMVVKTFMYFSAVIISGYSQMVQVDDSRSGYAGSQVDLSCQFVNSDPPVKISQVTWQKFVNGTKQNVAIANPALGVSVLPPFKERVRFKSPAVRRPTPSLEDTTITFSNLRLTDEAAYICEYTTFPAGNRENTVNLTVYARPMIQMSLSTPTIVAGPANLKMTVATCLSANGKPAGVITWDTGLDGEVSNQEIRNPDGTFTVRSDYVMVPTRQTHNQKLTCITSYHSETYSDSVTLNIQYEPEVTIEGYDGNWYLNRESVQLICQTDANPPVSLYQWRFLNGSIPDNVEVRDNILLFKGPVTYDLAGTYMCDATNSIGTRSAAMEVNVTENPLPLSASERMMSVLGWVVALGIILAVVLAIFMANRQQKRSSNTDSNQNSSSPAHKKASKKRGNDDFQSSGKFFDDLPNTADYVSYRLACHKEDFLEQHSPPIHPPLSFLPQNPCAQHASESSVFKYPTPGNIPPYTFPKEQYV